MIDESVPAPAVSDAVFDASSSHFETNVDGNVLSAIRYQFSVNEEKVVTQKEKWR